MYGALQQYSSRWRNNGSLTQYVGAVIAHSPNPQSHLMLVHPVCLEGSPGLIFVKSYTWEASAPLCVAGNTCV